MASLGRLVASLALDTTAFVGGLDKASYQAKQFERDVARTFSQATDAVKGFAGALVGGLATVQLGKQIKDAIDYADALGKAAQVAGVTANELGGLQMAAELGGVSAEGMNTAVKKLSSAMFDAAAGTEKQAQLFAALGVQIADATGKMLPASEVMKQIADKFMGMEDGAAKTALAIDLFGKSGADMIPMLNQGSAALAEQIEFFTKYVNVSDETVKSSELFNDTLTLISKVMSGVFMRAAEAILPPMQQLIEYLLEFVKQGSGADGITQSLAAGFKLLASTLIGVIASFKTIGTLLGGIAAAAAQIGTGEFRAAADVMAETFADLKKDVTGAADAMGKVWVPEANKAIEGAARLTKAFDAATTSTKKKGDAPRDAAKAVKEWEAARYETEGAADAAKLADQAHKDMAAAIMKAHDAAMAAADADAKLIEQEKKLADQAAKTAEEIRKRAEEDFKKQAESINKSLTDALMRGFESGEDFAANFAKTLQNMFKTLVLRPVISAIVQPIAGGVNSIIGGMLGTGIPAGSGGGLLGSVLGGGNMGGMGNLLGGLGFGSSLSGGGLLGAASGFGGGLTAALDSMLIGGGMSGMAGGALTGALGMMGAAMPWVAGALAIASALGAFKRGGPKGGGSAIIGDLVTGGLDSSGRLFTPSTADAMVGDIAKGVTRAYEDTLKALGGKGELAFGIGFDTDPKGTAENRLKVLAQVNGSDAYRVWDQSVGRDDAALEAALQLESQRALLAALQSSEFPAAVAAALNSVVASTATEEQVQEALQFAAAVKSLTDVFDAMGDPMKAADEMLAAAGRTAYDTFIESRKALLDLSDGFDATLESTEELTAASAEYAKAMITVIAQIKALKVDIDSMFTDTAQRIRESVMTEDELYADLQRQAEAAFEALQTATDPAEVAKYAELLNSLLERSFGMLSPEDQKAAANDYLKQIEMVNGSVQSKLDAMADVLVEAGQTDREFIQSALDSIVEKFGKAGDDFSDGAAAIAASAARGVQVDITVEDGRIDYQVTG
jgi:hypothetical protein